jgi:hypothetical protein
MSYRSTVLSDYPLAYYPLDDLTTGEVGSWQDILDTFATYADLRDGIPIDYPSYANMSGTTAFDYSGSQNNGQYNGAPETEILPIVLGNSMATKINNLEIVTFTIGNDYTGNTISANFATAYSSDNDFTLEAWVYPHITTSSEFPLFGDPTNSVGLFYKNGNIVFKLDTEEISWTAPYLDRVMHIVGVYKNDSAYLYIDGVLQSNLSLNDFAFTNTSVSLQYGPTGNIADWMLGNSFAVYRYALSENQIRSHYQAALGLPPIQIVNPDSGSLFEIYDNNISTTYYYSYPANKPWSWFDQTNIYYNGLEDSISLLSGATEDAVIEDFITIPAGLDMNTSKIEWYGTNGVQVESSVDGVNWLDCSNREPIPQYTLDGFDASRSLYLRITLTSLNSSIYIPKLYNLGLSFYNNPILYSVNSGEKIVMQETSLATMGNNKYNILNRDARNGILCPSASGFDIDLLEDYQTIELFYTRLSEGGNGLLLAADGIEYSWGSAGTITSSGITSIWVNGIDKTLETDIDNVFKLNQLSYVVMVLDATFMGLASFNNSSTGDTKALYQNMSFYTSAFDSTMATEHYNLYTRGSIYTVTDLVNASLSLTENSVTPYNNDWLVIQNT